MSVRRTPNIVLARCAVGIILVSVGLLEQCPHAAGQCLPAPPGGLFIRSLGGGVNVFDGGPGDLNPAPGILQFAGVEPNGLVFAGTVQAGLAGLGPPNLGAFNTFVTLTNFTVQNPTGVNGVGTFFQFGGRFFIPEAVLPAVDYIHGQFIHPAGGVGPDGIDFQGCVNGIQILGRYAPPGIVFPAPTQVVEFVQGRPPAPFPPPRPFGFPDILPAVQDGPVWLLTGELAVVLADDNTLFLPGSAIVGLGAPEPTSAMALVLGTLILAGTLRGRLKHVRRTK